MSPLISKPVNAVKDYDCNVKLEAPSGVKSCQISPKSQLTFSTTCSSFMEQVEMVRNVNVMWELTIVVGTITVKIQEVMFCKIVCSESF